MTPPSGATIIVYFARSSPIAEACPTSAASRNAAASGPSTAISAMCDRSNNPAAVRTATCSARSDV